MSIFQHSRIKPKQKKKFRLTDLDVLTVGLVDNPAVGGSRFIIAKRQEDDEMDTVSLTRAQARTLLTAIHLIEDCNVPQPYDSNADAAPFPPEVMDHVSALRALLGDTVAKRLEAELAAERPVHLTPQELAYYRSREADEKAYAATLDWLAHLPDRQFAEELEKYDPDTQSYWLTEVENYLAAEQG